MKVAIRIEYTSGESATYIAAPPEWARWEQKFGKSIQQAQETIGVSDLLFLAYSALKREAAGKPVKPYEVWIDTVSDIETENIDPKASELEA